jgi:hypothetical protein
VIFSWQDEKEGRRQAVGLTRDISVAGAFVLTPSPPPLEANVRLKLILQQAHGAIRSLRIDGQGVVSRVEPAKVGESCGGFAVAGKRFVLRRGEECQ